jgi:uncharacterized protein (UPF0333 family)
MKKGQAAMEFLMTYGWAILVVLAAIAALAYFGIFNVKGNAPDQCYLPTGYQCQVQATTNQIVFRITNGAGVDLTNVNITVDGCTGVGTLSSLNDGAKADITVTGCSFTKGQKIKKTLIFGYTEVDGFSHNKPGSLIAVVE